MLAFPSCPAARLEPAPPCIASLACPAVPASSPSTTAPSSAAPASSPSTPAPSSPAPASSPSAPAPGSCTYTVKPGDSLYNIATANGLTLDALLKLNPQITSPDRINAGDAIKICSSGASRSGEKGLHRLRL